MYRVRYGLIALALAVFAVAGFVLAHQSPVKDAGQNPVPAMPVPSVTPSSPAPTPAPAPRVVAFLGDDWTKSVGASAPAKGFVAQLAAALNLRAQVFAVPGAGYARTSPTGRTYADLVPEVVKAKPAAVVVSGGRNDAPDYLPTAALAAHDLFAALHSALPSAKIVAVAPMWGDSAEPQEIVALGAAVESAVQAAGGSYVDATDPIHGHPDWMADQADPNDRGYAAVAGALEPKLEPLLR